MKPTMIPQDLVDQMTRDRKIRVAITKESFSYFFHFYFAHYVKYATADFQKDIIHRLEKDENENLYVIAFRGSGKSTMITTAYPIWSILGKQHKRFVVIFCQTQSQAKQHMMNLRRELEENDLLKRDMGPFQEDTGEWGSQSLVFSNTDARITVASTEQSIRGLRHHEHRPDLIICDDVEDIASTKTPEGRKKTYQWLRGDVIPAGDKDTRLIVVGNLLHEDSLLMRLKDDRDKNKAEGAFLYFPLIDETGKCLWPGKYPTDKEIEAERRKIGNEAAWQREFLLHLTSDQERIIQRKWIHHYPILPSDDDEGFEFYAIGIDLAATTGEHSDYTAMVIAKVVVKDEKPYLYILPNPINERMPLSESIEKVKRLINMCGNRTEVKLYVENVTLEKVFTQLMRDDNYIVETVKLGHLNKEQRLMYIGPMIESGQVLFPEHGIGNLLDQVVDFQVARHNDLADALSLLVLRIQDMDFFGPIATVIIGGEDYIDDDD